MKFNKVLNEARDIKDNFHAALKKFHSGAMKIEFMLPKGSTSPVLLVDFDDDLKSMMNISTNKLLKFNNPKELLNYIYNNFGKRYQYSDMRAVSKEIFDYKEMNDVFNQIKKYMTNYPNKTRSLTYKKSHAEPGEKNPAWDMEIIFRRSVEKWSKDSSNYRIHPAITGSNEVGKIISPDEVEVYPS